MTGMGIHDLSGFRHEHEFDRGNRSAERRTWVVVAITAATMVAEIVAGILTGSMALLADGWHMATHVVALSIAGFAYLLARRWAGDERFAFGTWKIEVLGSFASALVLGLVACVGLALPVVAQDVKPSQPKPAKAPPPSSGPNSGTWAKTRHSGSALTSTSWAPRSPPGGSPRWPSPRSCSAGTTPRGPAAGTSACWMPTRATTTMPFWPK